MALSSMTHDSVKTYNGSVTGTAIEVTDNSNALIYSITLLNTTAALAYFQVFDADSANVTVGTTTPTFVIGVAASGTVHCVFPKPIRFTTGFTIASTTARADATGAIQEATITYMDAA